RTAIDISPKNAKAHNNLGTALHDSKNLAGAIKHYRTALDLDPNYAEAHNNLGNALDDSKDLVGAIKHFRTAIELDPKYALAHGALGQALLQKGQFAEAREATRQCLKLLLPGDAHQKLVQEQLQRCEKLLVVEGKLTTY